MGGSPSRGIPPTALFNVILEKKFKILKIKGFFWKRLKCENLVIYVWIVEWRIWMLMWRKLYNIVLILFFFMKCNNFLEYKDARLGKLPSIGLELTLQQGIWPSIVMEILFYHYIIASGNQLVVDKMATLMFFHLLCHFCVIFQAIFHKLPPYFL